MKTIFSFCLFFSLCVPIFTQAQIVGIDSMCRVTNDSLQVAGSSDTIEQLLVEYRLVSKIDTASSELQLSPTFHFNNQGVIPFEHQAWLHIANICEGCTEFMTLRLNESGVSGSDLIYTTDQAIAFQTGYGALAYRYWITAAFPCDLMYLTEGNVRLQLVETSQQSSMLSDTTHYFYSCLMDAIATIDQSYTLSELVGNHLYLVPGAKCNLYDVMGRCIVSYENLEQVTLPVYQFVVAQIVKEEKMEVRKIFVF